MVPRVAVSQAQLPVAEQRLDATTARLTATLLATMFQSQSINGTYAPGDDGALLATRPLFATMAFDAYQTTHDAAALSQAAYSISRYYGFLTSAADHDGDRLIEVADVVNGQETRVEDPAFNALLAVDTRNLARLNLELRRTMPALYWYDAARSIERAVVAGTFDPETNYCFARDPASGQSLRRLTPVAALPAEFAFVVGSNHAEKIRAHVVGWASGASVPIDSEGRAQASVEQLCAIDVLRGGDHAGIVDAMRKVIHSPLTATTSVERYALARSASDVPLTDDTVVLGLLLNLERKGGLSDGEMFRLEHAIPDVALLAFSPRSPAIALDTAEGAIRAVYTGVSVLRERLRSPSFFNEEDKRAYPGVDANVAAQRLLDDVTCVLRRAENRAFAMRYPGVRMVASPANDQSVNSETMVVRWEISTDNAPSTWKAISAGVFGEAVSPVGGSPATVSPGVPLRFTTRYTARNGAGTLRMLTFTAVFDNPAGGQSRCHIERSIYLNPPVAVVARFPRGRTIQTGSVPIQLTMRRHSGLSAGTKYFWFSPAGLRVSEGSSGTIMFGAADSTATTLHVEIPSPCRPGVFPFTLKFFSNDRDAGSISSSLFKPYQWTFVGPFAAEGVEKVLAPEKGVSLLQNYPGPNGSLSWRSVPESACDSRGGIVLRELATDTGVNYLYTIVACAFETEIEARLASNESAVLFVNGRRVAAVSPAAGDSATATVHLAPDKNHILIKVLGGKTARVSFALGNDDNLAADEFDNNLAELAAGYRELTAREMNMGSAPSESRRLVTLRFQDAEASSVAVVGNFNGWSPATHQMKKNGDTWELTVSLAPGRYAYRFLVDQKKQVLDPSSAATEADGYGGKNSVLVVNK